MTAADENDAYARVRVDQKAGCHPILDPAVLGSWPIQTRPTESALKMTTVKDFARSKGHEGC